MDYENYDNDTNESDEEYFQFVRWLENMSSVEFRAAKGDSTLQKLACCRYFKRGYSANLTTSELIDFLGTSTNSVLDKAGYSDEEALALFQISDALTDEEIATTELLPSS